MSYKLIVAFDNNRGIGIENNLPWKIQKDISKFIKLSKGNGKNAIIMGKNTWISLPIKPLKDRFNIILSKTLENNIKEKNIRIFSNIEDIINFCKNKFEEIWVIGGEKIYSLFLQKNLIDELHITHIDNDYKCDTFFPEINYNIWKLKKLDMILKNNSQPTIYNKIYIKK